MSEVAVLIVTYNGSRYLDDCLASLLVARNQCGGFEVLVFDNASTDDTVRKITADYPWLKLYQGEGNLGFAEGNNRAFLIASQLWGGLKYIYLLNQDTVVNPDFMVHAIGYADEHPEVEAVQSLILLHEDSGKAWDQPMRWINTSGNRLHYLGFGLPGDYRRPINEAPPSGPIGYPSGAGVLIRRSAVGPDGPFFGNWFMYLEDAQLGWTMHLAGRPPHYCRDSVVGHKYSYATTTRAYRYLERNRLWLCLTHYRVATLLLLLPMFLVMEAGQWIYAVGAGQGAGRFWVHAQTWNPAALLNLYRQRRRVQHHRVVPDREILAMMMAEIESPHLRSPLLNRVANPLMKCYLVLARRLVFW